MFPFDNVIIMQWLQMIWRLEEPRPRLNIKTAFPGMWISLLKMRRSCDRLIFIMGIPIPQNAIFTLKCPMASGAKVLTYGQTSIMKHTLIGNKVVDHSDVVGASPVGAAPTTSSFST